MTLQIRRGTNSQRTTITPAEGELLYTTDTNLLYVGGKTGGTGSLLAGGIPVAPVQTVNGQSGNVALTTDNVNEGTYNSYFTTNRARDAAAALLTSSSAHGIVFSYSAQRIITATVNNVLTGGISASYGSPLAYYATAGQVLSPSASVFWDDNINRMAVRNGTYSVVNDTLIGAPQIQLDTYNSTVGTNNTQTFRRARGTIASPLTMVVGDTIGMYQYWAHDGTNFVLAGSMYGGVASTVSTGVAPGLLSFSTSGTTGGDQTRVRIDFTGRLIVGPYLSSDTTSGGITVRQTTTGQTNSTLAVRNYYTDAYGPNVKFEKFRGTFASWTPVIFADNLMSLKAGGATLSGATASTTGVAIAAQIDAVVDGAVSSGIIPGALIFSVTNSSGTLKQVIKIGNDSTIIHSGTITTTSAPGTIWNYDSSNATVTLSIGGTVAFASFSGSILVNCYNSGTVTQYLCGGGTTPTAIGSSKGSATGTMASTSGISGYTFTATEAGVHSFYVIRTRAGA